jgi:hypothetical protein
MSTKLLSLLHLGFVSSNMNGLHGLERLMVVPVALARLPPKRLNANEAGCDLSASWTSILPRKRMSFNR